MISVHLSVLSLYNNNMKPQLLEVQTHFTRILVNYMKPQLLEVKSHFIRI